MSIGGETINIPTYSITYLYLGKLFLERKDIKSLTVSFKILNLDLFMVESKMFTYS